MGAVQASDYALGEFRMLWRLLLVHGRWNYIRISDMILYFFYKNMLFTLPQFIFGFYCAFSGQSLFDDWYISLYNLIFTSIPLVVRAIFEQDVNYIIKKHEVEKNTEIEMHSLKTIDPVILRQEQYLPPGFVINKYLYRLFPKMYFIGQHNCIFNYRNYTIWIVESFI
jgi:magnesium-transporting ATPase (P-type)